MTVFDDFEMTKRFLVPTDSDWRRSFPFFFGPPNGNKQVRLELFNPRLDDQELDNPTDLLPPTRSCPNSTATLNVIEIFPVNGGTNFTFERVSYAVNEEAGSISIDIIHPAGTGGNFDLWVLGSGNENLPWVPGIGSDLATEDQDFLWSPTLRTNLTIAANQVRTRVTIPIIDDNEPEFNEDIYIFLDPVITQPPVGPIRVARITILDNDQPAGALDRRWNPDNVSFTTPRFNPTPGADGIVRGAAVQADQRTVIVGDFTSYNAEPCGYIARINTDGSYDTSFSPASPDGAPVESKLRSSNDRSVTPMTTTLVERVPYTGD